MVAVRRLTSPMRKRLFSGISDAACAALAMSFVYRRLILSGVKGKAARAVESGVDLERYCLRRASRSFRSGILAGCHQDDSRSLVH